MDGVVVSEPKVIEEKITSFFTALLNGHHDTILVDTGMPFVPDFSGLDFFLDGLGTLPDIARDELETAMTVEELRYIIKDSKNNKSP